MTTEAFPNPEHPTNTGEATPTMTEQEYRHAIWERLDFAHQLQARFANEALARGADEQALTTEMAEAMSAGVLPAVVPQSNFARTSFLRPVFLGGKIPGDALDIYVTKRVEADGTYHVAVKSARIEGDFEKNEDDTTVFDMAAQSNGAFTAVGEDDLERQYGEQQGRHMLLTQLDQALAPFVQAPEQS